MQSGHTHVFHDPSGRRRRRVTGFGTFAAVVGAVCLTVFVVSLLVMPLLPHLPGLGPARRRELSRPPIPVVPSRQTRLAHYLAHQERKALWTEIDRQRKAAAAFAGAPARATPEIVAAFYTIWNRGAGLQSLIQNADRITHLMPEWLHLDTTGVALDTTDWNPRVTPQNRAVVHTAFQHRIQVYPILNNAKHGQFDPQRVHRLLASQRRQQLLADRVRDWLKTQGFQGINVDFENLAPEDYARLPQFVALLGRTLRKAQLGISIDLEPGNPRVPFRALARASDFAILMTYPEHGGASGPGPLSSIGWYYKLLQNAARQVPADRLVLGLGNYALDWALTPTPSTPITLSYQTALITARDFAADSAPERAIDFDSTALNPTFNYTDEQGQGHEVWMLDGVTAFNEWMLASRLGLRGAALWVLGSEDPAVWAFLGPRTLRQPPSPLALQQVEFPDVVEFTGNGEILTVASRPRPGSREIDVDSASGLATDVRYRSYASSNVIRREGYHPGWISLTFDDGPSGDFTGPILDVLKELHVPATFFVVGQNAESFPELVRREYAEGHEIGNHSFTHVNMGAVSQRRDLLEINATQRVLEAITGHSTTLFRAPYNADAEPDNHDELYPLSLADSLGYIFVGEVMDPQDWNTRELLPGGGTTALTPQRLAANIIEQVDEHRGDANVLLLHDAGGNRSATVEALRIVVPQLQEAGYRFVTVSQLANTTRNAVMPVVTSKDLPLVGFDRVAFGAIFTLENLLVLAFILGVTLGIGRALLMVPPAIIGYVRAKRKRFPDDYRPRVSVLIAAYNERPVIVRTVATVLASEYPDVEVIVVDDGSADGTGDAVEEAYAWNPAVQLIRQPNGGKAMALNRAIAAATGEVLVCFDADTQIAPDTIAKLVRHFADRRIGAVAGNVKVGNRINLLTRWQSIEYVTSQNLDRRVYALMNAVTVVPGAVGAWRREAVAQVGGYIADTLAEDMDLTFRLRRAGWKMETDSEALGWTEAPQSFRSLFRQRFRWSFGTLQCLWKHKGALGRYGFFGRVALPVLWVFQVVFQLLAPLVDLQMLYAVYNFGSSWLMRRQLAQDWQPLPGATHLLMSTGFFYGIFFAVELLVAIVAYRLDGEKLGDLKWLFWQRFVYRQLMYAVLWKAITRALRGGRSNWGKLERKGTVALPAQGVTAGA